MLSPGRAGVRGRGVCGRGAGAGGSRGQTEPEYQLVQMEQLWMVAMVVGG